MSNNCFDEKIFQLNRWAAICLFLDFLNGAKLAPLTKTFFLDILTSNNDFLENYKTYSRKNFRLGDPGAKTDFKKEPQTFIFSKF